MKGLYIHVPFCEKRCFYCSFYSTTQGKDERRRFVQSLLAEMYQRRSTTPICTLYFGGGTPSQLDEKELRAVFAGVHEYFTLIPNAEITFEANPDDVDKEKLSLLVELGVNRLSLGVQSFDDRILQIINRRHNSRQAFEAIRLAKEVGIANVSIDLIYGLPTQSIEQWERDLLIAFDQDIQHVSAYSLMYEEGTVLYKLREQGKVKECDEELSLRMFERLIEMAEAKNFEQYEISNFARKGFRSQHNSSYWKGYPYIGLGPSAHSYDGGNIRRFNLHSQTRYAAASQFLLSSGIPKLSLTKDDVRLIPKDWDVPFEEEQITPDEQYNEFVLTTLRTKEGMPLFKLTAQRLAYVERMVASYLDCGWLQRRKAVDGEYLSLTRQGIFRSDYIMAELMWDV